MNSLQGKAPKMYVSYVVVEGVTNGESWRCGLEFDYANEESFYCRPLLLNEGKDPDQLPIPEQVSAVRMAYLPPMLGLATNETRLDPGVINVRLGERKDCGGIAQPVP